MSLKIFRFSLFIVLFIQTVNGAVNPASFNNWCTPAGNPNMQFNVLSSGTATNQIPPYHYTSNYVNANNQVVPLLISLQSPGVEDWKAYWMDKTGKWNMVTLLYTKSYTYINLINNFLFTMAPSGMNNFNAYKINEADQIIYPYMFNGMPFSTLAFNRLTPYSIDHTNQIIFVMYQNTEGYRLVTYKWTTISAYNETMNYLYYFNSTNIIFPHPSITGNGYFYLDSSGTNYQIWSGSVWATYSFVFSTTTSVLKAFQLKDQILVNTITNTVTKTGEVGVFGFIVGGTLLNFTSVSQIPSTTDIQYFCDEIFNFVRVTSNQFFWLTMKTSTSARNHYRTSMSSTEVPDLTSILSVGMSQNKASVYYSNGKLEYYRHVANSTIERFYSKTLKLNAMMDLTQTMNYQLNLACSCQSIQQMGCSSQSLYCVTVNRPLSLCKGAGDTYTKW